jgi:hypothetical protein
MAGYRRNQYSYIEPGMVERNQDRQQFPFQVDAPEQGIKYEPGMSPYGNPWTEFDPVSGRTQVAPAHSTEPDYDPTFDIAALLQALPVRTMAGAGAKAGRELLSAAPQVLGNEIGGLGPLFNDPRVAQLIVRNLQRSGAGAGSSRRFAENLADVPYAHSQSPGTGMLGEFYDALGIKGKPELQSMFGPEIETGLRVPASDLPKYVPSVEEYPSRGGNIIRRDSIPKRNFLITSDGTIVPNRQYPYTAELLYGPIKGLEGVKEFTTDAAKLQQSYGGRPLAMSGPEFGAGAHTSISNPGMDPATVSKFVERFMEQEPYLYPSVPSVGNQRSMSYTKSMPEWASRLTPNQYNTLLNPKNLDAMSILGHDRYHSLNLQNLTEGHPASRIEMRMFHGTADPNEWAKQFLIAESLMQDSMRNKGVKTLPSNLEDFLGKYEDFLQTNAADIKGFRSKPGYSTSQDPYLGKYMEKGALTKKKPVDVGADDYDSPDLWSGLPGEDGVQRSNYSAPSNNPDNPFYESPPSSLPFTAQNIINDLTPPEIDILRQRVQQIGGMPGPETAYSEFMRLPAYQGNWERGSIDLPQQDREQLFNWINSRGWVGNQKGVQLWDNLPTERQVDMYYGWRFPGDEDARNMPAALQNQMREMWGPPAWETAPNPSNRQTNAESLWNRLLTPSQRQQTRQIWSGQPNVRDLIGPGRVWGDMPIADATDLYDFLSTRLEY